MKDRRLYDFFNDKFEAQLPSSRSMEEAYNAATEEIWATLRFMPYSNFQSFNRIRKKRKSTGKKSPLIIQK